MISKDEVTSKFYGDLNAKEKLALPKGRVHIRKMNLYLQASCPSCQIEFLRTSL